MPAEKRSPDDAAGALTGAFGGAALGALSGGGDALGGRRPAAHLPSTHAKQLRQRAPGRGPRATQISAPMPTAGRSANRRAHYERIGRALRHMDAAVGLSAACAAHHRGEGEEKPRIGLPLKVVGPLSQEREKSAGEPPWAFPAQSRGRKCKGYEFGWALGWGAGRAPALPNHSQPCREPIPGRS
jgi:hypothetical protein